MLSIGTGSDHCNKEQGNRKAVVCLPTLTNLANR